MGAHGVRISARPLTSDQPCVTWQFHQERLEKIAHKTLVYSSYKDKKWRNGVPNSDVVEKLGEMERPPAELPDGFKKLMEAKQWDFSLGEADAGEGGGAKCCQEVYE